MKKNNPVQLLLAIVLLASLVSGGVAHALSGPIAVSPGGAASTTVRNTLESGRVALPFVRNDGQWGLPDHVAYYVDTFAGMAYVQDTGLVYSLPIADDDNSRYVISESFVAVDNHATPTVVTASNSRVSYFLGQDRSEWASDVPTAHELSYGQVWDGVAVTLRAYNNTVEKLFTVAPGASVSSIAMKLSGVTGVRINTNDELVLSTPQGDVVMSAPIAFQNIDGQQIMRDVSYVVSGNNYGFSVPQYDGRYPLVIDPLLQSTYLGGTGAETSYASPITTDSTGNVYLLGTTASAVYPGTTGGYQSVKSTGDDIVISKLSSDLTTLIQSTYLGGTGTDNALRGYPVFDSTGNVYILGYSNSTDFPGTAGGYQSAKSTGEDIVVAKLNSDLTSLIQSTYVGGTGTDVAFGAVSFDSTGSLYFMGVNQGGGFPGTAGGYQAANAGGEDIFVAKMNSSLTSLIQATYYGGTGLENGFEGVTIDSSDNVYIAGHSNSAGLTGTTGGYQSAKSGGHDMFLVKFNNGLTTLTQATYFGGSGLDAGYTKPVLDGLGNLYIAGETTSANLPGVTGGYQPVNGGGTDFFIAKLSDTLTSLVQSTYLGGTSTDYTDGSVRLDSSGNVYVGGFTASATFPGTSGGYQGTFGGGGTDLVIAKFNSGLTSLIQSTFLGGSGAEETDGAVHLDSLGNVYIGADTLSTNFPGTTGGYQSANAGGGDFIIAKLTSDLQSTRVTSVNATTVDGSYNAGDTIDVTVVFNHTVVVTGMPQLTLETGATDAVVNYSTGSGTNTLTFTYTIASGETSSDLDYVGTGSLALNGGTITTPADGFAATLTLPTPGAAGSLGANKALVVDTTVPSTPNTLLITPVSGTTVISNPTSIVGAAGSVEASSTVTLLEGVVTVCTTVAAVDGSFTCSLTQTSGSHTYTMTATDAAGNVSVPTADYSLVQYIPSGGGGGGGGFVSTKSSTPAVTATVAAPVVVSTSTTELVESQECLVTSTDSTVTDKQSGCYAELLRLLVDRTEGGGDVNDKYCRPFITGYVGREGISDDPAEVLKLQRFLRHYEGETAIVPNGIYDAKTRAAVVRMQEKYADDVLAFWGLRHGSGAVYITTKNKVNALLCGAAKPDLVCPRYEHVTTDSSSRAVRKLQTFMNANVGSTFNVDGVFTDELRDAVRGYQDDNRAAVLNPWNLTRPTGLVLQTTRKQMHRDIGCFEQPVRLPNGIVVE